MAGLVGEAGLISAGNRTVEIQQGRGLMADLDTSMMSGLAAGAREAWARRDRVTWTLVGLVVLIGVGLWGFLHIWEALAPFIVGGFIAFLLRPVVGLLTKRKLGRGWAVLLTSLVLVALLVVVLINLVPLVAAEVQKLSAALPTTKAQFQSSVNTVQAAFSALPEPVKSAAQSAAKQVFAGFSAAVQQLSSFILGAFGSAIGFGFQLFLGWIISIWLLLGGPEIAKWSLSVLPPAWREDAAFVGRKFDTSFGGYIRGTVICVTITFLGCALGFSLVGLPYAIGIAALVGALDVIPFIGPIIGGAFATIVGFTVSPTLGVITLVIVLIVEQSVDSVISPIVMGDSVRLHPLGILLALSIGGALGGFFGVIVSIPASAAGYAIYLYFMRKYGVLEPEQPRPEKAGKKRKRAEAVA